VGGGTIFLDFRNDFPRGFLVCDVCKGLAPPVREANRVEALLRDKNPTRNSAFLQQRVRRPIDRCDGIAEAQTERANRGGGAPTGNLAVRVKPNATPNGPSAAG